MRWLLVAAAVLAVGALSFSLWRDQGAGPADAAQHTPPTTVSAPPVSTATAPPVAPNAHERSAAVPLGDAQGWRDLLQVGQFEQAYAAMRAAGPDAMPDTPAVLMDAATASRLGGHPREAAGYLMRVVTGFPGDALAPLAAFTLGRVQLERLGQPREAAEAFAKARELAPNGTLAEDALAREVEAWATAGERGRARERARAYERGYPDGTRLRAVRRHADLK